MINGSASRAFDLNRMKCILSRLVTGQREEGDCWANSRIVSFLEEMSNEFPLFLALSDLLFNVSLLCRGIQDVLRQHSQQFCMVISFLSNLAELLSALYIVSFTIQRYLAVHHPFQAAMQSRSSPLLSLISIFIASFAFCFLIATRGSYDDCQEDLSLTWFTADAVFSFAIPFFLIALFNILIIFSIRRHLKSQIIAQSLLLTEKCSNRSTPVNSSRSGRHDIKDGPSNTLINTDEETSPIAIVTTMQEEIDEFQRSSKEIRHFLLLSQSTKKTPMASVNRSVFSRLSRIS